MNETRSRRRQKRIQRRKQWIARITLSGIVVVMIFVTAILVIRCIMGAKDANATGSIFGQREKIVTEAPPYDVQLLSINEYSRPGIAMEQINGIVIHYTANPGTTAQQNRDYFEGLALSKETYASSHFVIGLSGEIIQCIPSQEIAYASNDRNSDTISIECCILDETGEFSTETYQSLVHLVAWLMGRNHISIDNVIRHYDVTGKNCPKYYVEHEDAWIKMKQKITDYIEVNGSRSDA